jgi:hypothetical protein
VTTSPSNPGSDAADPERVPFVASLRVPPGIIRLGPEGEPRISIRVEVPEVWDAVRVDAPLTESVFVVKTRALTALYPDHATPSEFVVKRNGIAIEDETVTLAEAGVRSGSTLLVMLLRRRPVRS